MANYTAITIGPVYDTMKLTSKPAGLWAASYLFSDLSREICEAVGAGGAGATIITPVTDEIAGDDELSRNDGVGLFPDHIIFELGSTRLTAGSEKLGAIFKIALKNVADRYEIDKNWLLQYLQIHAVDIPDSKKPISDSGVPLAASELEYTFPVNETRNYLLAFFENKQKDSNESISNRVKKIARFNIGLNKKRWTLLDESNNIRDMESIAGNGIMINDRISVDKWREKPDSNKPQLKKFSYYAIIKADGDNFGKLIKECEKEDKLHDFSLACWSYSKKAAKIVSDYGGVVIYAGGDDLLCITPLDNEGGQTVFDLVLSVRKKFDEVFQQFKPLGVMPTLSFGVAIRFYKYPLYESFNEAHELLSKKAKDNKFGKDAIAVSLQKHSGQSVELVFQRYNSNPVYDILLKLLSLYDPLDDNAEDMLHSVETRLHGFKDLFALALHTRGDSCFDPVKEAIGNMFDSEIHRQLYAKQLLDYTYVLLTAINNANIRVVCDISAEDEYYEGKRCLAITDGVLRMVRFFAEKGVEKDDERTNV